jgi:hypothetical protein
MAHELCHSILRHGSHSDLGIMRDTYRAMADAIDLSLFRDDDED